MHRHDIRGFKAEGRRQVTTRPGHIWPDDWSKMLKSSLREALKQCAEQLILEAAREHRGIAFIPDDDPGYEEVVHNARRASVMSFKVTTPVDPKASTGRRPCAGEWSRMETKRLNSLHVQGDIREDMIIESQKMRTSKGTEKRLTRTTSAGRGYVCMSHKKTHDTQTDRFPYRKP